LSSNKKVGKRRVHAISGKNLASTIHHCANEFFIVDIAMRVLLIHQKLLNLKNGKVSELFIDFGPSI